MRLPGISTAKTNALYWVGLFFANAAIYRFGVAGLAMWMAAMLVGYFLCRWAEEPLRDRGSSDGPHGGAGGEVHV